MDQRRRIHDAYDEIAADYDDQRTAPTQGLLDGLLDCLAPGSRVLDTEWGVGKEFARVCRPGRVLFTASSEKWSGANDDWLRRASEWNGRFPTPRRCLRRWLTSGSRWYRFET